MSDLSPIAAFDVFPDGRAVAAATNDPAPVEGASWRWIHVDLADPAFADWCDEHLDDIPSHALMQAETRPRMDRYANGLVLNLRGVNLNPDAQADDMVSLRLWVTETLVVSARFRKVFAVDALREQGAAGSLPISPGAFLAQLVDGLTDRIEDVSLSLEDQADTLEETLFGDGDTSPDQLARQRLTAIRLRRYVGPQREALMRLAASDTPILAENAMNRLRESANRAARTVEELDAIRERLTALQDHIDGIRANAISRNGNILSIVAAIFLPLGFLTGLFGMNVAGLPGTEWQPAFVTLSIAMAILGVGLTVLFRWMKWF